MISNTQIGILGAGQLGRMLALAGVPLGLHFRFLDPAPDGPAARLGEQLVADYADAGALARFADGLDVVTYEFENVPVSAAEALAAQAPIFPPPAALAAAQDRLVEKRFFQGLGIPTAPFLAVDTRQDLDAALQALGLPAVLKTRRLGYDGKGQHVLREPADAGRAWAALAPEARTQPLILEGLVPFRRELSILAVRGRDGATACYPLIENNHREGILRRSIAPAPHATPELQALAESFAVRALDALGYVGVLAIELFEIEDGRRAVGSGQSSRPQDGAHGASLVVNEMAPRVHNSGHWTIEGAETSQFENHLRAVAGLPLGSTAPRGHAAMVNLIGALPDPAAVLAIEGAHLHLYEKAPRPGRKVGHVTLRADDAETLTARVAAVERLIHD